MKKAKTTPTYKAIVFCRVSSYAQDYNRQISDLLPFIKKDGYKKEEIYIIHHKESATKNDVSNRVSITELKDVIKNNPIEGVYVTEISRLARRNDVLYHVLALLEEKQIALITLVPMVLRTIKKNGEIDPMAHIVIQFLAQAARAEMEFKSSRQKSGYEQKIRDGKVVSSKIKFGYKRTNGFAEIDEEKAIVVRDIFGMYLEGKSVAAIWDKYEYTGVFAQKTKKKKSALTKISKKSGWNKIGNILSDPTYIGENGFFNYPAIISEEVFNAVKEKLASNVMIKSRLKYVYYCQGLLKCNGHTMTPAVCEVVYSYRDVETRKTTGINMNAMDSLLFNLACVAKANSDVKADEERIKNIANQLDDINNKLVHIKAGKAEIEKQTTRAFKMYVDGKVSADNYNVVKNSLDGQMEALLNTEQNLETTKIELEAVLDKQGGAMEESRELNSLLDITDDNIKYDIIHEVIDYAEVNQTAKGEFEIKVFYVDKSFNTDTYYKYVQKGCKKHLYCCYGDYYEDWTNGIVERVKRYQRKQ